MFVLELFVALVNEIPDAVRFVVYDSPAGNVLLRALAFAVNGTLFEDASIGS